jgi:outer membrane protein, heavy metal efflux system
MTMTLIRNTVVALACLSSLALPGRAADATSVQGPLLSTASASARAHDKADCGDLPPEARLREWLLQSPAVQAAGASQQAQTAEAEQWRTSPHEFIWRVQAQQRRAQEALPSGANETNRFMEGQVSLERTLRLGDKAQQDIALGDAAVAMARVKRADAIHEASRTWLRQWFDWLRDRDVAHLWQTQMDTQTELLRQAERRVKAGDAPRLELALQQAAQAQVQASLMAAQAQARRSQALLEANQPGITTLAPQQIALPLQEDLPKEDGQTLEQWLIERSHEAELARLHTQVLTAQAARMSMDMRSDPTLGVYAGTDRGGKEHVLGVSVSMPLAGPGRLAASRMAHARMLEAEQQALSVQRKVKAEAAMQWVAVQSSWESWRAQAQAKTQVEKSMKGVVRGWQLGEFAHADVLMARKQFMDVALAEITARAEARHTLWRLKLDLHEILEFDDE